MNSSDMPTIEHMRAHIRWHAELGDNGFDTLPTDEAAEHAQWRLRAIVRYLDRLDDADRTVRIFRVVGLKSGENGETLIGERDPR